MRGQYNKILIVEQIFDVQTSLYKFKIHLKIIWPILLKTWYTHTLVTLTNTWKENNSLQEKCEAVEKTSEGASDGIVHSVFVWKYCIRR